MNDKKFYLIYKITNNLNQKFYIGKHETNNLDDDYFGSGKHLNNAKEKYGLQNFTKTILFYCQNREEMNLLEHCVVTPEFCKREDVYNMNEGGDGGWNYVNVSGKGKLAAKRGGKIIKERWNNLTPEEHQLSAEIQKKYFYDWFEQNPDYFAGENNPMYHHEYTKETHEKMSNSKTGSNNNRYGTVWISNLDLKLSISIEWNLAQDYLASGWIKKRIIKWK